MTEFWKSNPMYWCDYCKVWMQDNPTARATHENGIKHKDHVARKLRHMQNSANKELEDDSKARASMAGIELQARRQYQQDIQAASLAQGAAAGSWSLDEGSGLLYNAQHGYYYDRMTQMYYGGDPPAWVNDPPLPPEGLVASVDSSSAFSAGGGQSPGHATGSKKLRLQTEIGGYQMPQTGAIGGAKKINSSPRVSTVGVKRTHLATPSVSKQQKMSPEEAAAVAKREAARARVQSRTMQTFGLT